MGLILTDTADVIGLAAANDSLAIAVGDEVIGLATSDGRHATVRHAEAGSALSRLDAVGPRWVWWSKPTMRALLAAGVRPTRCWDLSAVHRLLAGGWSDDAGRVWAFAHDLDLDAIPTVQPIDLFHQAGDVDPSRPLDSAGYVRAEWAAGEWARDASRTTAWAALALDVQQAQEGRLRDHHGGPRVRTTALSESAAEMICAELEHGGLPFDRDVAEEIVAGFIGPKPSGADQERELIERLDGAVLRHLPAGARADLRRPDHVKSLLRRVGIEVPDTRAWRLEQRRNEHPIVEDLLAWRRAERIRTTFGYEWIDSHVGDDGRLRGQWSGSDGAAGRMTATAGLHNMPAEMRPAVASEAGRLLVRADLGQIEPRVLAAISGDRHLIAAAEDDDMYAPVAHRLGVERAIAKVAVLGAMYGQTTGIGAEALRGLEREYPVAMGVLRRADEAGQGGRDLHTIGGRRIAMSGSVNDQMTGDDIRSRAAARGRYGRNAIVQGAAAEFFKTWAALVRARGAALDAHIVLCLHDELVVDAPGDAAEAVARLLLDVLDETARRWLPAGQPDVRFVADVSIVERWSDVP